MLSEHLEKLVHFAGVAKSGSIRKYAISKGLSQPAISKSIQKLESVLETTLIIRSRDGIELTKSGLELSNFAEETLARAHQVELGMRKAGSARFSALLTMGTYHSIAVYFMPKFIKFIRVEQPEIKLNLRSGSSAKLISALRAGELDFVISIDPPKISEFVHTKVFEDTYSLFRRFGNDTPIEQATVFTLPTAMDEKGKLVTDYLLESKVKKNISECGDFESVKAMIEQDVGFGFLPDRVAGALLSAGKIERVSELPRLQNVGKHSIQFSCRRHHEADETVRWIREQLMAMLK